MQNNDHIASLLAAFDYDKDGIISADDLHHLFGRLNINATMDDCEMLMENLLDFTKWKSDVSSRSGLSGLYVDGLDRILRASAGTEIDLRAEQWILHFLKGENERATSESIHNIAETLSMPLSEKDCGDILRMWGSQVANERYCKDKMRAFGYIPQPPLDLVNQLPLNEPTLGDEELIIVIRSILGKATEGT